jgi:hypothetical protein
MWAGLPMSGDALAMNTHRGRRRTLNNGGGSQGRHSCGSIYLNVAKHLATMRRGNIIRKDKDHGE